MSDPKFEYELNKAERDNSDAVIRSRYKKSRKNKSKQLLIAIISALIVLVITESLEGAASKWNSQLLAILAAGLFGIWISEWLQHKETLKYAESDVIDQKRLYEERKERQDDEINALKIQTDKVVNENNHIFHSLKFYFSKMGVECNDKRKVFEQLEKFFIEEKPLDKSFEDIVMFDLHQINDSYCNLRKIGKIKAPYRKQIDLASVFCRLSKSRFWATSTDRVSSFQIHNYNYYDELFQIAENLRKLGYYNISNRSMPRFARVFVGELHSFAADLIDNPRMFFDLYKMHIFWGKEKNPDFLPIRFFIDNDPSRFITYERLFQDWMHIIDKHKAKITDFMLVDDFLVYGREGEYSEDTVILKLATESEIVKVYDALFPQIWEKSISIEELTEKVLENNYPGFDSAKQDDFINLCKIAESKLDIRKDYTVKNSRGEIMLPIDSRIGVNFFNRVCHHISNSTNLLVAVDRADRKTGNFWEAWLNSQEYLKFHEACKEAVQKGATVYRLFILEKDLNKEFRNKAKKFLDKNLNDSINIGFVYAKFLTSPELELRYIYDFILVNMPSSPMVFSPSTNYINSRYYRQRFYEEKDNCLGFELLGDQSFIAAGLTWEDNLIAKDLLLDRLAKFRNLWISDKVVKSRGFDLKHVDDLLNELFL